MQSPIEGAGPFPIFVPRPQATVLANIVRGSAIVGFPLENDASMVHVFFEGNITQSEPMRRFADRAKHASGRCRWFRVDVDKWRREHPDRPLPSSEYGYAS